MRPRVRGIKVEEAGRVSKGRRDSWRRPRSTSCRSILSSSSTQGSTLDLLVASFMLALYSSSNLMPSSKSSSMARCNDVCPLRSYSSVTVPRRRPLFALPVTEQELQQRIVSVYDSPINGGTVTMIDTTQKGDYVLVSSDSGIY